MVKNIYTTIKEFYHTQRKKTEDFINSNQNERC